MSRTTRSKIRGNPGQALVRYADPEEYVIAPNFLEAFFALSFDGRIPQGTVQFHEAFKADGPQ